MDDPDLGKCSWAVVFIAVSLLFVFFVAGCSPLAGSHLTLPPKTPIQYPITVRCKEMDKMAYVFRGGDLREAILSCIPRLPKR